MSSSAATSEQILVLLEFLLEHRDLARNYIKNQDGRARAARLWAVVTQQLNSLGGAVKTAAQWQKVWADKKYLTKKVTAQRRRQATGTGGGPSVVPPETEVERRVLEIMGEGFGCPSTQATIPPFVDKNRCPNPRPSPPPVAMEEVVVEEVVTDTDHLYCLNPPSPATPLARRGRTPAQSPPGPGPPSSRRVRMRPRRAGGVNRIAEVEEEKRDRLAAIEAILASMDTRLGELVEVLRNLTNSRN